MSWYLGGGGAFALIGQARQDQDKSLVKASGQMAGWKPGHLKLQVTACPFNPHTTLTRR